MGVTVNEQGYRSYQNQTGNLVTAPARKWFSLQSNRLDGTFHPMDSTGTEQTGWWGASLSGAGGVFAAPHPQLTATFAAEDFSSVQVAGDSLLGEYPVDFEVRLYNAADGLLWTETVTGNTAAVAVRRFPVVARSAAKLVLTITRWSTPGRTVKINEAFNAYQVGRTDAIRLQVTDLVASMGIGVIRADTVLVQTASNRAITARHLRSDVLAPKAAEIRAVTVRASRADAVTPKMTEARAVTNTLPQRVDSLTTAAAETRAVTVQATRVDSLAPVATEVRSITVRATRPDGALVALVETEAVTAILPQRVDTLAPYLADSRLLSVQTSGADALAPKLTEVRTLTVQAVRTDGAKLALVEARAIANTLPLRADVLAPKVVELRAVTVRGVRTDALTPLVDVGRAVTVHTARTDGTLVALVEIEAVTAQLPGRADSLAPMIAEVRAVTVQTVRPDSVATKVSENRSLSVRTTRGDSALVLLVEATGVTATLPIRADVLAPRAAEQRAVTVQTRRPDTLAAQTGEVRTMAVRSARMDGAVLFLAEARAVTNTLPGRSDLLRPKVGETRSLTNRLGRRLDTVVVKSSDSGRSYVAVLTQDKAVVVIVTEPNLHNIHSVMNADLRRIFGRVEITYTDPFMDESIQVTASGTAHNTHSEQVADNLESSLRKWFSLHHNKLDGTFHPISADGREPVGWWSDVVADGAGVFAVPPSLAVQFRARPINRLRAIGDDQLGEYPVDFRIRLYGAGDQLLYTENVVGNTQVAWSKPIEPVLNVTKMEIAISKVNRPGAAAKLLEFYTAVQETYEAQDIQLISLLEEMQFEGATLPIGNISANELTVRLDNTDRRFDPANPVSPLRNLIKKNRRVRAWLGSEVVEGEIEWYQIGEFWTRDWRTPETEVWAEARAWDRLEFLRASEFGTSLVYQGVSLCDLAEIILADAGLRPDEYEIDQALQAIIVPYAWFPRVTHRDALQQIAAAALGQCYCDRNGKIVVQQFQPANSPMFVFTRDNIMDKDHPLAWEGVINHVEVQATTYRPDEAAAVLDDDEPFIVPAGGTVERLYAFDKLPVINVQAPVIVGDPHITVTDWAAYAWGMRVLLHNSGTGAETVTHITAVGTPLKASAKIAVAEDAMSISDLGKQALSEVIANPLIQTSAQAQAIADALLASNKDPRRDIILDARGNIALRLGDRIKAPVYRDLVEEEFYITRQTLEWDGGLQARVEARKIGGDGA